MKFDAYQMVTDRICKALESGVKPWQMPWVNPMNCAWSGQTGNPYSFLNQILLIDPDKEKDDWMEDIRGEWLTFHQIQERGGKVKKGEHGRKVVFFKMIPKKMDEAVVISINGEEIGQEYFPYLTVSTVFHIRQCEGVQQKYHTDADKEYAFLADATAESVSSDYLSRSGVKLINTKSGRAFYRPSTDEIHMPKPEQFKDSAEYYSTLFHEMTHSTGHPSRLDRVNGNVHFGDESYSQEELVAEIGSASILSTLGIESTSSFTNSAAYIANWLTALKNDKTLIVKAAAKAEKAVKLILNIKEV